MCINIYVSASQKHVHTPTCRTHTAPLMLRIQQLCVWKIEGPHKEYQEFRGRKEKKLGRGWCRHQAGTPPWSARGEKSLTPIRQSAHG